MRILDNINDRIRKKTGSNKPAANHRTLTAHILRVICDTRDAAAHFLRFVTGHSDGPLARYRAPAVSGERQGRDVFNH